MNLFLQRFSYIVLMACASSASASDITKATGIVDACAAGALLDSNHISYRVMVFHESANSTAGCIFGVNGSTYLYTRDGSVQISEGRLDEVPHEKVTRADVLRISDGRQSLHNGCLVFAACAYNRCKANSHILWAGLVKAEILQIESPLFGGGSLSGTCGHALTAFENDKKEIYVQENGKEPKMLASMTQLAQSGKRSWHDASTLIFYGDQQQAFADFASEYGSP